MKVMVYPDDMETHCGGVMAKYHEAEHRCWVIVTIYGNKGSMTESLRQIAEIRKKEQLRACRILGMEPPVFWILKIICWRICSLFSCV